MKPESGSWFPVASNYAERKRRSPYNSKEALKGISEEA
jgi:hypothetical protein